MRAVEAKLELSFGDDTELDARRAAARHGGLVRGGCQLNRAALRTHEEPLGRAACPALRGQARSNESRPEGAHLGGFRHAGGRWYSRASGSTWPRTLALVERAPRLGGRRRPLVPSWSPRGRACSSRWPASPAWRRQRRRSGTLFARRSSSTVRCRSAAGAVTSCTNSTSTSRSRCARAPVPQSTARRPRFHVSPTRLSRFSEAAMMKKLRMRPTRHTPPPARPAQHRTVIAFQICPLFQRGTYPFHRKFCAAQFDICHPVCNYMECQSRFLIHHNLPSKKTVAIKELMLAFQISKRYPLTILFMANFVGEFNIHHPVCNLMRC